jgi:hypothetical protein
MRGAPRGIVDAHPPDQRAQVRVDLRPASKGAGFPTPVPAKAGSVPSHVGLTYLITAGIYAVITAFAVGERARSFKAISPGLLPPLGIIFGLFVVFTAAQVWTDNEKARAEIDREASALRNVAILA